MADNVEKLELMCIGGRNIRLYTCYEKTVWCFVKKLKIELSYDPASSLLSTYLKVLKTGTKTVVRM